ncbi:hypothetical protein HPB48_021946 [Haemaphysalis longicornis]|uniref:Uncharacterized protein n=1 Tax=Haemaphysalis longicornis TaxID=44386 RepID=A0A9J6GQ43_HAELO|nr:hypothetical protein HPB48_021946 [Haemaphysalis longicornis]
MRFSSLLTCRRKYSSDPMVPCSSPVQRTQRMVRRWLQTQPPEDGQGPPGDEGACAVVHGSLADVPGVQVAAQKHYLRVSDKNFSKYYRLL